MDREIDQLAGDVLAGEVAFGLIALRSWRLRASTAFVVQITRRTSSACPGSQAWPISASAAPAPSARAPRRRAAAPVGAGDDTDRQTPCGLAVGLLEGAIFLHPVVLAVLPGTATRLADILAVGAGLGAAVLGGLVYAEQGGVAPADSTLGVPVAGSGTRP